MNNTERWKIVLKIFGRKEFSRELKWELFEDMKGRDSSDTMINKKIACQSLAASDEELEQIYNNFFLKEEGRGLNNFIHQLAGFNKEIHEKSIRNVYLKRYFKDIKRFLKGEAEESEKWFASGDELGSFLTHFDPIIEGTVE